MDGPKFRQAVLLIHGIGEQRPMSTLRGFVEALTLGASNSAGERYRSKPDDLSRSFELRRLVHDHELKSEDGRTIQIQICFFEYYWAYRLRDTKSQHIRGWAYRLLFSPRSNVPDRLKWTWLLCWGTVFIAIVLGVLALLGWFGVFPGEYSRIAAWAFWLWTFSLGATSGFWLYWVGDAARYLNSAPGNIAERHAIRTDGVALLRGLHEAKDEGRPKYARIVVVGHSLGSVIGYDALKFYWAEVNQKLPIRKGTSAEAKLHALVKKGRRIKGVPPDRGAEYQQAQAELFKELPEDSPWRVTDFVTLGSPLTYAGFLLADSNEDLDDRRKQRELPTCPPVEENKHRGKQTLHEQAATRPHGALAGDEDYGFAYESGDRRELFLHHAAHFALTKLTNLYFPGDIIGGEIGHQLGLGVVDVPCDFGKSDAYDFMPRLKRSERFWSHVQYWQHDPEATSVGKLRSIIFDWRPGTLQPPTIEHTS
jgi:hypothetical protein